MSDEISLGVQRAIAACCILTVLIAASITVFAPVAFMTSNTRDAFFLLDVGWRTYNGAVPAVDFQHFYGGLTGQIIAWAMMIFGPSMKALDQGIVLIWIGLMAATGILSFRRLGWMGFLFLASIISATILSKAALNDSVSLTSPVATYGTLYNRFGLSVALVVTAYCLVPARDLLAERAGAFITGLGLVVLTIIKPTFAVLVPAALLSLVLQARWSGLGFMLLAGIVFSFLIDPLAVRFLGSIDYIRAIGSTSVTLLALIAKGIKLLLIQPFALTAALLAFAISAWQFEEKLWRWPLAALVLMAAMTGMAATMAREFTVGQQMVPCLAAFTVFAATRLRQADTVVAATTFTLAAVSTAAFAAPMLLNTIAAGAMAINQRNEGLIASGPAALFVSVSYTMPLVDPATGRPFPLPELTKEVARAIEKGQRVDSGMGAVMIADGLDGLSKIKGTNPSGIVSEKYNFSFATGTPPVLNFPTYQRSSAPELAADIPFPKAVDTVMLLRNQPNPSIATQDNMVAKMGDAFTPCLQTDLWVIYTRADNEGCAVGPPLQEQ